MRFGVVGCSACGRVQAVELRFRTVACVGCRRPMRTADLHFLYRGDDEAAARATVLRVTAARSGMGIEEYARVLATLDREPRGTIEEAIGALARRDEFGAADFGEELRRLQIPAEPERLLATLVTENRVYEPRPGRYRVV